MPPTPTSTTHHVTTRPALSACAVLSVQPDSPTTPIHARATDFASAKTALGGEKAAQIRRGKTQHVCSSTSMEVTMAKKVILSSDSTVAEC
jgi:hypothetical protein